MSAPPVRGLILSGGTSSRMGQDKGRLLWKGIPLIQRQVNLLCQIIPSVVISCRQDQVDLYHPYGDLLIDDLPSHGPMSGLLTAFQHAPENAWFVLAVDMPNMDAHHLAQLLHSRNPKTVATVFQDLESLTLQPLAAIWEPTALPLLTKAWQNQRFSLLRILESNPVTTLFPTDKTVLNNVNRPEDLPEPS
ncbi:MAG: molybdenum cofactor guanylyltransferase [Saprospiraceae bacterium]|nr:molybdenum cofactor guanylyltransferase [Saprospiraceae bacterium]